MKGFPVGLDGKESACNARDPVSITGSGRCPGEGNDNPSVFLPGKSHGKATPHGVTESDTTERLPRYNDMSPNREYQ